jgi:hypothetical protein
MMALRVVACRMWAYPRPCKDSRTQYVSPISDEKVPRKIDLPMSDRRRRGGFGLGLWGWCMSVVGEEQVHSSGRETDGLAWCVVDEFGREEEILHVEHERARERRGEHVERSLVQVDGDSGDVAGLDVLEGLQRCATLNGSAQDERKANMGGAYTLRWLRKVGQIGYP